jgi:glutamyl-tRNA synthetase
MVAIRTRFAPSPTGFMHIGSLRTALYSYAFAKSQKSLPGGRQGKFVLRIEDTDRKRFQTEWVKGIYRILKIFKLDWDEGPFIQSERAKTGLYRQYAEKLVKNGHAYYCRCPAQTVQELQKSHAKKEIVLRDPCRLKKLAPGKNTAIRLRVPDNERVSFFDFVLKKEISWETKNIDEVMLLKSDGMPTYHLGVVVDDALMKITHIIRGRDWLPSTPIHLLLYQYLGFKLPEVGHLTDILDPAGGKLSKRKGSVSCEDFLAQGYLPEAILNFIMLLGWAPKDNREIFSLADFVKEFPKGTLQVANPVFNRRKLDWFNGYYIRQKTNAQLGKLLKPFAPKGLSPALISPTVPLVKERLFKLADYAGLVDFLVKEPKVDGKILQEKAGELGQVKSWLEATLAVLSSASPWRTEKIESALRALAEENHWPVGHYFMALRIILTGKTITPPLFESISLLGKEKTLRRLRGI